MSVIVLHGRNAVDIEDRVAEIVAQNDPQTFNTSALSIESAELSEIGAAISTPGFFGSGRILVIRGVPGADKSPKIEWDDLEPLLSGQPDTTITILVSSVKIPANRKSLKTAKTRKWSVELHDLLFGRDLEAWVARRGQQAGAEFEPQAIRELLTRLYPTSWQREDRWNPQTIDMRLIATEVEKLAAGSADGTVTRRSVEQLVMDRSGVTAFKLNDETFEGRAAAALIELDNVLANGEAPERVIGQIGYQPTVLLAAGYVQRYGVDTVAEASGISAGQLKATIGRKSAWRNRRGLDNAAESLRRSEWLVKTGRSSSSESVLAPLVAEIAEGFSR